MSSELNVLALLGISFALAMDAFAVAASVAVVLPQWTARRTFRLAWHFGLFQGGMCLAGGLGGRVVSESVAQIDHWIVFGVLMFLGIRMIRESFQRKDFTSRFDPTRGWSLVVLSIATSIDALAVGVSLGLLGLPVWIPALVIGLVALGLTTAACHVGRLAGSYLGRWAERFGGLVLIGIGCRILYQHLF